MKVYLKTEQDWIDFVNGQKVVALRNPTESYYKEILVSQIEIASNKNEHTVTIIKRY